MRNLLSPLRYPGGKSKVFNIIVSLFEKNDIRNPIYIEPFAGGAGLALLLLKKEKVKRLVLNDIDKGIYSFWYCVLNHTEKFCNIIENIEISLLERENQKKIYINKENLNLLVEENILKLGVATFYLNRVNRSGILKAGVIGGNLQNGNYKMDCRFNKNKLIKQIKEIGRLKDKIEFYNLDVLEFQKNIISKIKREKFIFFDPPYYKKGPELYTNFYNHKNHLELYETIRKITKNWIVTYDNCEEIKKIYKKFDFIEFDINYSLENKMKAKEIMIFSKNIKNHDIFIMK